MDHQPREYGVYTLNGKYVVRNSTLVGEPIVRHDAQPADNALPEDMRFFGMSLADAQALAEHLLATYGKY